MNVVVIGSQSINDCGGRIILSVRQDISPGSSRQLAELSVGAWSPWQAPYCRYRLLRYVGATDADIDQVHENVRRWSRGGVWIELAPGRKNLLKIRAPFDAGLLR